MNWSNVAGLALAFLVCVYVAARIERKSLWLGLVFFILPFVALVLAASYLTGRLTEAGIGAVIALVLGGAWWFARGRRQGRVSSDSIKVWGQDSAPPPKAALQAEIDKLKEEKDQLEAELRKLRGEKPTNGEGGSG